MFILYAVLAGLAVGALTGGRPSGLASVRLRWSWVIVAGLLVQVVLFSGPVSERIGDLGPLVYVASTAAVLAAIVANRHVPGLAIVAVGAVCNLTAIIANGGYMPADPGALAALGKVEPVAYSNSSVVADPVLAPLTDIFAMPTWLPFANVFSVGDILIGVGVMVTIVVSMRSARFAGASDRPGARPAPESAA